MTYEEDEWHMCHFCGTYVKDGYETVHEKVDIRDYSGDRGIPSVRPRGQLGPRWISYPKRHYLSDCRPDLVYHEPGPTCTWALMDKRGNQFGYDCYAYQDENFVWTTEHKHFYRDGAM